MKKLETIEELLAKFNKANNQWKGRYARQAGYNTAKEYKDYLLSQLGDSENKKKMLVINVLDTSSSMTSWNQNEESKDKLQIAINAINNNTHDLTANTEGVDIKVLYNHFDEKVHLGEITSLNSFRNITRPRALPATKLSDAIGLTFQQIQNYIDNKSISIVMNIYTDGGENYSNIFNKSEIAKLITKYKNRVTVTFIGTKNDVASCVRQYSLEKSNTLEYDNTAKGLEKAMMHTAKSMTLYTNKVRSGKNTSKGFYKNIIT